MRQRELDSEENLSPRRRAMVEARRSKRPSRAGRAAGTTPEPDQVLGDAGFTDLLNRTLASARAADGLPATVTTLLTLDGHLGSDDALRALTREEAAAVRVLTRPGRPETDPGADGSGAVFTSALALSPQGRLVVTVPKRRTLPPTAVATGVAERVAWSAQDLVEYRRLAVGVDAEGAREIAECRALLHGVGDRERAAAVDALRAAVFLVPPVTFFHGDSVYSNLRDPGNLTGKTLLPSHPDCFFHRLDQLPLDLWSDEEAVVVACLWLLYLSGGPNRLESANGYQLSLRNVADNFRSQCTLYAGVGHVVTMADESQRPATAPALRAVADRLAEARATLVKERRLYYAINSTTRRKAERMFPTGDRPDRAEDFVCERLESVLHTGRDTFAGVLEHLREHREVLWTPAGDAPTGFEAVIETTVTAAVDLLEADYAMSRGLRSLPRLIDALATEDWQEIVSWELPSFYCCVVPSHRAAALYDGDLDRVADSAWAISARMQYNTWHVMPGNLPKDPAVTARDFLAPHGLPDIAIHSDLHHRGHVTNHIRYSARSPETVVVAGFPFKSLTDIRVLRCTGPAFTEEELLPVTRMARFVAQTAELVADTATHAGQRIEVTSFDDRWHHRRITRGTPGDHV